MLTEFTLDPDLDQITLIQDSVVLTDEPDTSITTASLTTPTQPRLADLTESIFRAQCMLANQPISGLPSND